MTEDGAAAGGDGRSTAAVPSPDPAAVPDVDVLVVDNYDSFAYNLVQYVGELAGDVTVCRNDAIDLEDVRAFDPDGVVISPGPGRPEDAGVSTTLFDEPGLPVLGVCLGHQALCAAYGAPVEQAPAVVHGKPSVLAHDGRGLYSALPDRLRVGRYHSLAVRRGALPSDLVETAWTVPADGATGETEAAVAGDSSSDRRGGDDQRGDHGQRGGDDQCGDHGQRADHDQRGGDDRRSDDEDGERSVLMGVRHREHPHYGVQFHPESILTGGVDEAEAASLAVGKQLVAQFCELIADRSDSGVNGGE